MPISSRKHWLFFIIFISLFLRFLGLNQINTAVFDEVFYPQYGLMYLQGEDFFYAHPPLANYLYSFAIWLYSLLPWANIDSIQTIDFDLLNPLSYRWINALAGSLLCLVIYGIALQFTKKQSFAVICSFLIAIEGSLIVDSRIALANIFLLTFGFLSLFFLLRFYLEEKGLLNLIVASIFMGMTISIKWSGLGFLLASFCLIAFIRFRQLKDLDILPMFFLAVFSCLTYILIFIPDLYLNESYGFIEKHKQISGYHQNMVAENEHPYCSKWYTWPIMQRPIGYFFEVTEVNLDGFNISYYSNIHLLPNPSIYGFSLIAISIMLFQFIQISNVKNDPSKKNQVLIPFVSLGYLANFLPWVFVDRCLFLYHYQAASVFSFIALAWYLSKLIESSKFFNRILALTIITIIIISFFYWLPLQMGFLIPDYEFNRRIWFQSWI